MNTTKTFSRINEINKWIVEAALENLARQKAICKHEHIVDLAPADGVYEMCADCHEPMLVEQKGSTIL